MIFKEKLPTAFLDWEILQRVTSWLKFVQGKDHQLPHKLAGIF